MLSASNVSIVLFTDKPYHVLAKPALNGVTVCPIVSVSEFTSLANLIHLLPAPIFKVSCVLSAIIVPASAVKSVISSEGVFNLIVLNP